MAKLSETFTVGGDYSAPAKKKLSETFSLNNDYSTPRTAKYTATPDNVIDDINSPVLYTSKKNNFTVTKNDVNKWSSAGYNMSDEEQKKAKEYLKKINYRKLQKNGVVDDIGALDLEASNLILSEKASPKLASFEKGFTEGILFVDPDKLSEKMYGPSEYIDSVKDARNDVTYGVGKAAGRMADYALLQRTGLFSPISGQIGTALGGGKVANAIGNIASDTLMDIGLDTIPELVGNVKEGKSGKEITTDALKNVGTNVAFNLGGELIGQAADLVKARKAAKGATSNIDDFVESSDIADILKNEDIAALGDEVYRADLLPEERIGVLEDLKDLPYGITNKEVDNIINTPELRKAWEEQNGTILKGTKAEKRKMVKDSLTESSDIPSVLAKEESEIFPNATKRRDLISEERVKVPASKYDNAAADTIKSVDDVPAKSVAEEIPTVASNKSVAESSGEFAQNRYSNVTVPDKTDMPDVVKEEFKENPQFYEVLKNKDTSAKATEILEDNTFNEAYRQFGELLSKRDPVAVPLGYDLAKQMVDNGNTEGAVAIIEELSTALTKSGQFTQAAAIRMVQSNPMAAMRLMQKDIDKINANGLKKYKGKWVDFALTDDEIKAFGEINPGDTESIQNLFEQITKRMADSYPASTWEKIVESTKTAMMLNPRTHIRNVAANTAMMPVRSLTDRVSALGQNIYHLINPDFKVTQSLTGGTSKQKKIADTIFDEQIKPLLEGSNKWDDVVDNVSKNKQVFSDSKIGTATKKGTMKLLDKIADSPLNTLTNGRIAKFAEQMNESVTGSFMENLRKFDYYLLGAVEDDPFVKSNFSNRLASYMKAQGINAVEDVPNEAIQTAYLEALKATFKDDNYMTKMFKGIKSSTGKFGEVLLPFVKTPANLAKRGIEYSPIGFVDTLLNANGKQASEIIDDIAKNVTGTAGIVLGYELAKRGLIQGSLSSDSDESAFEKQQGKQAFSININNHYYTFDWAQPASIPIVIGTTIYDAIKESDKEDANYLNIAKQSAIASVDAWADLSPISSLQDILGGSEYSSGSIGENVFNEIAEFPQRLIPSLSSATAKTTDPYYRQTYSSGNPGQTWIDTAKSKIPGLSETIPMKYDTWGNEKKRQDSTGSAFVANFLNPGSLGYDASTPIDPEIQRLFESTNNRAVFPNVAEWSVKVNDDTKKLTNREYSNYQRTMGQYSYKFASELMNKPFYNSALSDEEKIENLSTLYSFSKALAEKELFNKPIQGTNKTLYEIYADKGIDGVLDRLAMKKAFDDVKIDTSNQNAQEVYEKSGAAGLQEAVNIARQNGINKMTSEQWETYNKLGVDAYRDKMQTAGVLNQYNLKDNEFNREYLATYGQESLPVLAEASDVIKTIEKGVDKYGDSTYLNVGESTVNVYNQYGKEGLEYYRDILTNDVDGNGKINDSDRIPTLQSMDIPNEEKGYLLAQSLGKLSVKAQAAVDIGGYEDLYTMYVLKNYLSENGLTKKTQIQSLLDSTGMSQDEKRYYFALLSSAKNPY